MRKLQKIDRSAPLRAVAAAGIFLLMLALNRLTPYICDDFTYRLNFLTGEPLGSFWEIFPSMYAHSYNMNGRLISHGLTQVFMLLDPIVFDVVNAAVFTLTLALVLRLCGSKSVLLLAGSFCLLWLYLPVFGQVVLWQVGAINYFWSLTALVIFFTPSLLRLKNGRSVLKKKWHWAVFCVYGFFFGWYNEIASFVGICMVPCLVILDVWMNRRRFETFCLLPVLTAVLGYVTMLMMPAQRANKSGGLTPELLKMRFDICLQMLTDHLMPVLILFATLFVMGLICRLPGKTVVLSGLFALAGICANFMPMAASYYPERCMCTTVLLLLMAVLFLAAPLSKGKGFRVLCAACALVFLLTIPSGIQGCRDILSCHRQHIQREDTIAAALESGEGHVTANTVRPQTPWSGFYGLRDLMDDPETWPNHSMAEFYGLDSLIGE